MWGISSLYDPDMIKIMFDQTALFHLNQVKTPVLIERGEGDEPLSGQRLYSGLLHFGVPTEMNVYPRCGHGCIEPVMIGEWYRRDTAWLEYWIRNKPYRDPERQKRYDAWKGKSQTAKAPSQD
jgi:dipeptidyl aminopeptidase/acylaminoacyl peptidase